MTTKKITATASSSSSSAFLLCPNNRSSCKRSRKISFTSSSSFLVDNKTPPSCCQEQPRQRQRQRNHVIATTTITSSSLSMSSGSAPNDKNDNNNNQNKKTTKTTTRNDNNNNNFVDSEWLKVLRENEGGSNTKESFVRDMKMKGLMKDTMDDDRDPKIIANDELIHWLSREGDVYLSDVSTWGEPPHPVAISTETKDEVTNESSGRGLVVRFELKDGDEILRIPMKLCITKRSARKILGKHIVHDGMNEYLAIALLLIHEKYIMQQESFYSPYINILPEIHDVNPTFTWSDDDLQYLLGSPIVAATRSLQMKLRNEYDALLLGPNGLVTKYPQQFTAEQYTYDRWVWAFTILFSRAIRLQSLKRGETLALVPYADLINHSPFSQSFVDAQESGDWLFRTGEEDVVLFADRQYSRMDQVYISYGQKSNDELLLLYGFAVERNPYNSVDVTVSISSLPPATATSTSSTTTATTETTTTIDNGAGDANVTANSNVVADDDTTSRTDTTVRDPLAEEKIEFLKSVGRSNLVEFPCYADRYPIEMLEYLRLMQMTTADTAGRAIRDFDYSRPISTANEAAVLHCVVAAVKRQLSLYPQSEDDDVAIIKDKALFRLLSYNQRMAVRHRRNEKRLLKRTVAALEKQIIAQGLELKDDADADESSVLQRARGNVLGTVLPGDELRYGTKPRTALEDRLEKMGLPIDIK